MPLIPPVLGCYLGVSKFKRTGLDKLTNNLILWVSSHSLAICGVLLKDVRTQKFPRTDFFKTLTTGRK